jgi:hypothetical protein
MPLSDSSPIVGFLEKLDEVEKLFKELKNVAKSPLLPMSLVHFRHLSWQSSTLPRHNDSKMTFKNQQI